MLTAVSAVVIGLPRDLRVSGEPPAGASVSIPPDADPTNFSLNLPSESEAVEGHRTLKLVRAADGLFYATVRVEGQSVRFVIDTGANVVVLSAKDAEQLGYSPDVRIARGTLATAGGVASAGWVKLHSVDVGGIKVADVEAAVPQTGQGPSLMGQSLLRKLGTITLSGDLMTISCRQSARGFCSG